MKTRSEGGRPVMLKPNNRLLIVDDMASIQDDFRKILGGARRDAEFSSTEALLFGTEQGDAVEFALTMASQGEEAIALTHAAMAAGEPFALAFVDIRMPPGLDGVETARQLWEIDPDLSIVICSAYSDYAWSELKAQLGSADRWVLLKKPFENMEVQQLAAALVQKRALQQVARVRQTDLVMLVAERTEKLTDALARLEENAAERLRADEERRVLERKWEQAQRLESLGVLAGGIAHDFNNILTGILGRASLARLEPTQEAMVGHLREIELCARRAAELCEQMLTYAGQGRVVVHEVDINELVSEMDELVHASVPRDAEFRIELAPGAPLVRGDPARLRQVVMNLVINGAEALAAQPRRLCLKSHVQTLTMPELRSMTFPAEAAAGEYVVIEVSDTGSGMTPETIQRIFEPFFSTKFDGRGLGLCAVLGIVRNHGGALDVSSVPGKGSVFRVCLPRVVNHVTAIAPTTRLAGGRARGRVLVVDDEECVRSLTAQCLRRKGYEVDVASDGLEAVEFFQRSPSAIDGVVLDLSMPRMNGVMALTTMRQLRPTLPAVLISGHGQKYTLEQFADRRHTIALEKPFEIERLYLCVEDVLQGTAPDERPPRIGRSDVAAVGELV